MKDMDWTVLNARDQFEGLLDWVEQAAQEETAVHEVERSLFRSLLALGRTLLVHFLAEKGWGDCGRSLTLDDGLLLLRGEVASRPYRSIFGEVSIDRYLYGSSEEGVAPLDAELNLPEWKYSYLLQEWGLSFACKEAYSEAGQTLEQILGEGLAVGTLERLSKKSAVDVSPFRQEQPLPKPEEEAAFVVATVDCKGVPLTREKGAVSKQGKRRTKGEKKTQKKMACVGAVYSIDPFERTPEQILDEVQRKAVAVNRPIPYHKRVQAELLDDKASLFESLAQQVHQRQSDDPKPVLFLSDGERVLRSLQQRYLPEAIAILDLWHVMEYLWKGAHVFHAEGSSAAEAWVSQRLQMLLEGKVGYVIGGLKQMVTKHALKGVYRKTVKSIITYFHNNRTRMRYDEYLAAGYPIGSGVAEGACRHLVKDRMERTGMRWTVEGAQAILDLRSTYLNGDWAHFWSHHTQAERERIYGQLTFEKSKAYSATA
jgi:hypothetical protein